MMKLNFNAHTAPIKYTQTHSGAGTQLFAFVAPPQHSRFSHTVCSCCSFFCVSFENSLAFTRSFFFTSSQNERANKRASERAKRDWKKLHLCVANHFQENIIFFTSIYAIYKKNYMLNSPFTDSLCWFFTNCTVHCAQWECCVCMYVCVWVYFFLIVDEIVPINIDAQSDF